MEPKDIVEFGKWLLPGGVGGIAGLLVSLGVLKLAYRRERRFFENARRPIFLFEFGEPLSTVKGILQDTGFLANPEGPFKTSKDADRLGSAGLVVMSFPTEPQDEAKETEALKANREEFFRVFDAAKTKDLPIIVYCVPQGIKRCFGRLDYSRVALCNYELRLISDVFATLSTYPRQK